MPNTSIDQLVAETLAAMRSGTQLWVPDDEKVKAHLGTQVKQDRWIERSVAGALVDYGFVTLVDGPEGFRVYQRKKGS